MNERIAGIAFPDLKGKMDFNSGSTSGNIDFHKWCCDIMIRILYNTTVNIPHCDSINPVYCNVNVKIKYALGAATRVDYLPIGFSDLNRKNGEVYKHVSNRINASSNLIKIGYKVSQN